MRLMTCLLAVVLLAACGDDAARIAASPTPGSAFRQEPTEWFLRSISEDGKTIAFVYRMSGVAAECEREGRPDVKELPKRVIVTAHKAVTLATDRACTEELAYVDETVTLSAPVGERSLVGCRPGHTDNAEDARCRNLERSSDAGIFGFSPVPRG